MQPGMIFSYDTKPLKGHFEVILPVPRHSPYLVKTSLCSEPQECQVSKQITRPFLLVQSH